MFGAALERIASRCVFLYVFKEHAKLSEHIREENAATCTRQAVLRAAFKCLGGERTKCHPVRTKFYKNMRITWMFDPSQDVRSKYKDGGENMPMQSQDQSTLNVKLVHFTKQNSPDEPVQVAFAVIDDQGKEEIITGEAPYSYDLFHLFQENGWLNIRRGVASIRESRSPRRAMSA
jgi:hypothetical protein